MNPQFPIGPQWPVDSETWRQLMVELKTMLGKQRIPQSRVEGHPIIGTPVSGEVRNVIIIGSGPAGYTAGLYTARAMLEPMMFAGYMSGGQLMLTSDVENFPGYPTGIGGPEMMVHMREQAERFGLEVHDKNVERVDSPSAHSESG